jgi:hypothetical protein
MAHRDLLGRRQLREGRQNILRHLELEGLDANLTKRTVEKGHGRDLQFHVRRITTSLAEKTCIDNRN